MKIDIHNIDFKAMVSELKPWPRSPRVFIAMLGLDFQEIKTVEAISKIHYNYTTRRSPINGKPPIKKLSALARWEDLSQKAIDEADDFQKAQKAWEDAPNTSYVKEKGLLKMLEFSDKKQTKGIFSSAPSYSYAKRKALEKLITFYQKEK